MVDTCFFRELVSEVRSRYLFFYILIFGATLKILCENQKKQNF